MLHISLSRDLDSPGATSEQWNGLLDQVPAATIFQTYEWFESWRDAFGQEREALILSAHDQGELIGLAPLARTRGPLGLRQIEFLTGRNADYQILLARPDQTEAIARSFGAALRSDIDCWDMAVLKNLPANTAMLECMRQGFTASGLHLVELERIVCPTLVLRNNEDFVLRRLDRYSFRRKARKLEQLGPVEFRVLSGESAIESAMSVLFDQHRRRWAAVGRQSQFDDPAIRHFFLRLAVALYRRGWLHFSTLSCADRVVACHFGFQFRRRLYWYKPSFDLEFSQYSPGLILTGHLIQHATALGFDELDFTVGDEGFKQRFSNACCLNVNMRLFHGRTLHVAGLAYGRARLALRDVYHALKRIPASGTIA